MKLIEKLKKFKKQIEGTKKKSIDISDEDKIKGRK